MIITLAMPSPPTNTGNRPEADKQRGECAVGGPAGGEGVRRPAHADVARVGRIRRPCDDGLNGDGVGGIGANVDRHDGGGATRPIQPAKRGSR